MTKVVPRFDVEIRRHGRDRPVRSYKTLFDALAEILETFVSDPQCYGAMIEARNEDGESLLFRWEGKGEDDDIDYDEVDYFDGVSRKQVEELIEAIRKLKPKA